MLRHGENVWWWWWWWRWSVCRVLCSCKDRQRGGASAESVSWSRGDDRGFFLESRWFFTDHETGPQAAVTQVGSSCSTLSLSEEPGKPFLTSTKVWQNVQVLWTPVSISTWNSLWSVVLTFRTGLKVFLLFIQQSSSESGGPGEEEKHLHQTRVSPDPLTSGQSNTEIKLITQRRKKHHGAPTPRQVEFRGIFEALWPLTPPHGDKAVERRTSEVGEMFASLLLVCVFPACCWRTVLGVLYLPTPTRRRAHTRSVKDQTVTAAVLTQANGAFSSLDNTSSSGQLRFWVCGPVLVPVLVFFMLVNC